MTRFLRTQSSLPGVQLLERVVSIDERGSFDRVVDAVELTEVLPGPIQQINLVSNPLAGTVRGLHLQIPPNGEAKIITCIRGSIFDVAVDLRGDSDSFGQHVGIYASSSCPVSIVIPAGFAHGYQTLEAGTQVLYVSTAEYRPACEAGLNPFDEEIGISWPLACTLISSKDQARETRKEWFIGVNW